MTRLNAAGFVDSAAADRALAQVVAAHTSIVFAESASGGVPVNYQTAITDVLAQNPTWVFRACHCASAGGTATSCR